MHAITESSMDSLETSNDTNCHSLDMDLGRHLSQLSNSARFAVRLNQMNHVAIRSFYEHEEHGRAVTVYVVDVFLQRMQKGLPKTDRKREQQSEHPAYRVQHRYSEFRLLRQHIEDVVGDPGDDDAHPLLCPYCSRVLWLVTAGSFPSRYPNQGPVATCTGWRKLLTYSRKHSLEKFINALLGAAKDVSYRYTAIQSSSAMSLNEIYRIHIYSSYTHEDGATVYVVNVFLKKTQKGLPTVETLSQRKRRLRCEQKLMAPDYQVEHRYSDFRAMVKSISAVVNDHDHFRFCAYCSRVGTTESAAGFPSRVPSRGPVRQLVTRIRKSRLEHFVNQMLKAAKDNSYRSGSGLCHRFLIVSELLHSFLTPSENVCC
ncbi:hypothetical protein BBP00_00007857 [Phytophthora kernoviae]|uniref:PX domain-containing protein n=1 Tax=Phytophthora kernoviae TaxID=325452 RepID=A0A3F2RJ37_9STRA|nr:hypothetical protein BBP00_00007857 [Phytophthora kernoviae]